MGIGLTGNLLTYALLDGAAPGTIPASKDSSIYLRQAGDAEGRLSRTDGRQFISAKNHLDV